MEKLLQQLQQLIIGRDAKWKLLAEAEWYQAAWLDSHGVDLENSPKTLVEVQFRETREYRTVYVEIDSLDDTSDHTVTLDGTNNFSYQATSGDSENDVLTGLRDDINNNSTNWSASIENATTLKIIGDGYGQDDYTLEVSSSGSTTFITSGDAIAGDFRIHVLPKDTDGNAEGDWTFAEDGHFRRVGWRGRSQRVDTAEYDKLDVEVNIDQSVTGEPGTPHLVRVGPSIEEI